MKTRGEINSVAIELLVWMTDEKKNGNKTTGFFVYAIYDFHSYLAVCFIIKRVINKYNKLFNHKSFNEFISH